MKKLFTLFAVVALAFQVDAQSFGQTAPDFTVEDIDGNEISLYADILDLGIIAIVDVSATWCGPCWTLHESHVLQQLHEAYGPNGTNQLRVIYYEGDADTTIEDVQGTGGSTWGDWTAGTTYPIINESPLQLDMGLWAPLGFPTVNVIDPSDYTFVADPWNVYTIEGQVNAINDAVEGSPLDLSVVSVTEIDANADINVYPNPTTDMSTITLSGFTGPVTVQVFDLLGKEISSFVTSNTYEELDFTTFETGNYIVKASNDTAEVTKRVSVIN